jgi:hypothetical protein
MMALPSLWVASGEAPAKELFANVHYRRAFLLLTEVKPVLDKSGYNGDT